ncbi:MAG: D-alanine--D-alanine ligase [Anaerolineales bacterium]|nr:D-alanine--D-alanine ligase [Anaerolineales bacterium]
MTGKLRVGVIFGGRSGEHEVSLMSARSVLLSLDPDKYEILQIGITHEGVWLVGQNVLGALMQGSISGLAPATLLPDPARHALYQIQDSDRGEILDLLSNLDVVFPVLHGTFGEDGTLQGLLELADLAYVGAGVLGSALGMDKGVFKDVMQAQGIPVVEYFVVSRREIEADAQQIIARAISLAPFPLFVKPANLGSSVGITKCQSQADLLEGLLEAARYDRRVLVERGVDAREIEVSVLGNDDPQASIPGEILPSREFYSYEAKYIDDRSTLLIPAPLSPEMTRQIQEWAVRAYRAIDCAGMARVDFLLEKEKPAEQQPARLYLGEVNTIPGFTQISMYPKLWEASGLPYPALIDRLIELALERKADRDRTERRYRKEDEYGGS